VTEEKENRVVEIVLSSVPALPLMTGKIVGLGGAGLTQVLIWLVTASVALPLMAGRVSGLADVRLGPEVVLPAICYFVLGYVAYGAIFSAIGALAPGTREAQQYSGFFGVFAVVPLIFTAAFLSDIGSPIVTALSLIPLTAPAAVLQVLVLADEPPWLLVGTSLAILSIFTALATIASARVFRATLLLYGTRPSLRQVAGAILARG
jgi:ABC-2 type transport system permease protein